MSIDGNNNSNLSSKEKGSFSAFHQKWLLISIVLCIFLSIILIGLYSLLYKGPVELARGLRQEGTQWVKDTYEFVKSVGSDISRVLQFTPQVTINNTVVIEAHKPILELATIQREQIEKYRYEHSFLRSKKVFEVEARVRVKAGFDLKKNYSVNFDTHKQTVTAQFAPAQILSMEVIDYKILADQDGWWNKINAEEREEALKSLRRQAWKNALQTGILQKAETEMAGQLSSVIKSHDKTWKFEMLYKKD